MSDVTPADLMYAPMWDRIEWLLEDVRNDGLMSGVPRYQHRYTEREQSIVALLRGGIEHPKYGHQHLEYPIPDTPMSGRCAYCGRTM